MHKIIHNADGTSRRIHFGGWKRQHIDTRDKEFRLKMPMGIMALPQSYDNRSICSDIEDQQDLGSCTSNMFAGMIESNEIKRQYSVQTDIIDSNKPKVIVSGITTQANGSITYSTTVTPIPPPSPIPPPTPPTPTPTKLVQVSRLFTYYATRKILGTVSEDSGATIRDTIKSGVTYGVADETAWVYDTAKFAINPPDSIWTSAKAHKVTSYHSIEDGDLITMKSAISSGFLVGFGFEVYEYFMSSDMAKRAILPVPGPNEQYQGGHAVCLVGYDDVQRNFLVRNSWGKKWGLAGYFWMSYDYISNAKLASDFWVIQSSPV